MVPITNVTVHFNRLSNTTDESLNVVAINVSLAFLMLFTLIGNFLVLLAFYVQPRLRRVIYFPIISLALADLLCALTAMPLYIVKKNNMAGQVNERLVCDLYRFSYFFTEYASITSLMAISIERFLVIYNPLKYRGFISLHVMITGLIVCWLEALLVSSMPFYWRNENDEECTNSPTADWSFLVITVNVFLPFLVIFLCHCYIYRKTLKSFNSNHHDNTSSEYCAGHIIRAEDWKLERKATISFTVVVGVFILCWGPSTLYYFIRNICPECFSDSFKSWKSTVSATMKILTFANSFVNPIIYFWLNMDFRKAFVRVLKREWDSKTVVFASRSRSGTANSTLGMATTGNALTNV